MLIPVTAALDQQRTADRRAEGVGVCELMMESNQAGIWSALALWHLQQDGDPLCPEVRKERWAKLPLSRPCCSAEEGASSAPARCKLSTAPIPVKGIYLPAAHLRPPPLLPLVIVPHIVILAYRQPSSYSRFFLPLQPLRKSSSTPVTRLSVSCCCFCRTLALLTPRLSQPPRSSNHRIDREPNKYRQISEAALAPTTIAKITPGKKGIGKSIGKRKASRHA